MLIGEDLEDDYGGAFKVTRGLSTRFPGRVRNTPISEAAVVGFGNGLAIAGRHPIVEIMFGDFVALAADQIINQATKFSYIYNGKVSVPVIIRTPMGGRRGYGATHSQTLEKHFLGTPGLVIVAVNDIFDPAELLLQIHRHVRGPCLFIENKTMYASTVHATSPLGIRWEQDDSSLPTLRLVMGKDPAITVVAYGGMTRNVEKAAVDLFVEDEIDTDIIVPTCIQPLNVEPIVESASRTGRLLVVEEGQGFAGFGSEVVAACSDRLGDRRLRSARISAAPHPIPSARDQEQRSLPQSSDILAAMRRLASQP
jgi:pyruvate/2-oxoglutarate/acetoin dehydrogenase E1 component